MSCTKYSLYFLDIDDGKFAYINIDKQIKSIHVSIEPHPSISFMKNGSQYFSLNELESLNL